MSVKRYSFFQHGESAGLLTTRGAVIDKNQGAGTSRVDDGVRRGPGRAASLWRTTPPMMIAIDPANVRAMRATAFRPVHLTGAACGPGSSPGVVPSASPAARPSRAPRKRLRWRSASEVGGISHTLAEPVAHDQRRASRAPGVRHVLGNRQSVCVARVTAQQKVERDALIVGDRARGLTWATIEARHGVTERQCRTIWAERLQEVSAEPVGRPRRPEGGDRRARRRDRGLSRSWRSGRRTIPSASARSRRGSPRWASGTSCLRLSGLMPFHARAVRD